MSTIAADTPKAIVVEEQEKKIENPKTGNGHEEEEDTECEVNVRSEFKSCIDETLSTVCRVASMKRKAQAENK